MQWPALFAVAGDPEALRAPPPPGACASPPATCWWWRRQERARGRSRRGGAVRRGARRRAVRPRGRADALLVPRRRRPPPRRPLPRGRRRGLGAARRCGGVLRWSSARRRNLRRRNRLKNYPFLFSDPDGAAKRAERPKDAPGTPAARRRVPGARGGAIPLLPCRCAGAPRARRGAASSRGVPQRSFPRDGLRRGLFSSGSVRARPGGGAGVSATSPRRWTSRRTRWRGTDAGP